MTLAGQEFRKAADLLNEGVNRVRDLQRDECPEAWKALEEWLARAVEYLGRDKGSVRRSRFFEGIRETYLPEGQ